MLAPEPVRPLIVPSDPVFASWVGDAGMAQLAHGLVWSERGMGALTVHAWPYDAAYFEKYQRMERTPMGHAITAARIDLVRRHFGGAQHVIDIGIGSGAFISARGGWTWGYDVNPAGVAWLKERGRFLNPYNRPALVNAVTLWDVLEHIQTPHRLLDLVKQWVFCSLPIVREPGPPAESWRHFKPEEHCWYWTTRGLIDWMSAHGFDCMEVNDAETELGRLDIGTFAFKRRSGGS